MASYEDREAFIPFSREELLALCAEEGALDEHQCRVFRQFARILSAYKHYEYHAQVESLKRNFAPFNPDALAEPRKAPDAAERKEMGTKMTAVFRQVLERANYTPITPEELKKAFELDSLIKLNTRVEFDDFQHYLLYARGRKRRTAQFPWLLGRIREKEVENLDRVVVLLQFKERAHFEARKRHIDTLHFEPGKTYLYLYKNIPKYDLEVVFPNLQASMNWRDRLLFGVPALAGVGSVIIKSQAILFLIIGAALFYLGQREMAESWDFTPEAAVKLWAGLSSFLIAFGMVAFRQFNSFRTKKLRFQKLITETLFFKNIASNGSVFHAIIDEAEEEETKQMLLVFYHLTAAGRAMTPEELDDHIEQWFEEKHGVEVDFNIDTTLRMLEKVCVESPGNEAAGAHCLVRRDADGRCHALSLEKACELVDQLWDHFFTYANEACESGAGMTPSAPV
jgi:hypothetical protein